VAVADLDSMLEAEEGCSIAELFERAGEDYFRARERELLALTVEAGVRVLACGGGAVLDPAARARLGGRCRVVWLEVSPAEAARRVAAETSTRPLLDGGPSPDRLRELLERRRELYAETAEVRVSTDGRTPAEVADAVIAALGIGA
jgi:shikimate kinase